MAIITKVLLIVALACVVSALPLGEQEQVAQANLLSVNDVPQQDVGAISDAPVRQKRHGYGYGGECYRLNILKFEKTPLIDHKT